jgi:Rrf2 family protein
MFSLSARTHGALLLLTELARLPADGRLRIAEVSAKLGISAAYLEEVAAKLKAAGLVEGKPGPGGGYRLAKPPKEISLETALEAVEGPVALVDCQKSGETCPVASACHAKGLWSAVQSSIRSSLQNLTIADALRPWHSARR